jgi:hypothetical protein
MNTSASELNELADRNTGSFEVHQHSGCEELWQHVTLPVVKIARALPLDRRNGGIKQLSDSLAGRPCWPNYDW